MVAEPKVRVTWSARGNAAQMRLLQCGVFEIFFGGARGGGKTDGVLGEFGAHASRYGRDAIGLMVRRTRAELVETIERSREIYGPLGWQLNETEKMWRAPDGARLRFAYLERDADAQLPTKFELVINQHRKSTRLRNAAGVARPRRRGDRIG